MSLVVRRLLSLVTGTVSSVAFNPVITGLLLSVLTRGPDSVQEKLRLRFAILRDPEKATKIIKTLRWLLALGLIKIANRRLNQMALNAWRVKSEKQRWVWNKEVAVVTGGCSGIGELVVQGLIKKGIKVAVLDIQQLPESLRNYNSIKLFACDVTDPLAVYSASVKIRDTLGVPSILINNAGIARANTILDTDDEWLQKIYSVNLFSNYYTVKAFLPDMIKMNKGHIITVASVASYLGVAGMADYCGTKASVLSFHEGLNQELQHKHKAKSVLTTSVHPTWVKTPLIKPFEDALLAEGTVLLEPQEVADAIVNAVLSCSSGQIFLPGGISRIALMRGVPNWIGELGRAATPSKAVLTSLA